MELGTLCRLAAKVGGGKVMEEMGTLLALVSPDIRRQERG